MDRVVLKRQIAWQILAAGLTMAVVLFWLRFFLPSHGMWVAGSASLGSSVYLIYAQPSCSSSKPMNMLLCYILAFAIGLVLHWLLDSLLAWPPFVSLGLPHKYLFSTIGLVAVVAVLIASLFLKIPHPPAAGMALILALDIMGSWPVTSLFIGVLFLTGCRFVLRNKLVDLWD
jgi:CBS domain-containing membrane protein